jgi:hypothetical protein
MTEIDLDGKSEHDLLVITVTTLNGMNEKLNNVCREVDRHNIQLAILQTEHDARKNQPGCVSPSRKQSFTLAGAGAFVGGLITAVIAYFSNK